MNLEEKNKNNLLTLTLFFFLSFYGFIFIYIFFPYRFLQIFQESNIAFKIRINLQYKNESINFGEFCKLTN